jgi:hypothetical protein
MDTTFFENARNITALYNSIPQLQNVEIIKMIIVPGEDLELILTLDTPELPEKLPSKWIDRKVNTVQIELSFLAVKIVNFNIGNGCNYRFDIERLGESKQLITLANNANCNQIKYEAKWAYIKSISSMN